MATGNQSMGLTGLTSNVGRRESARQDLQTMRELVSMKQADEQKQIQAAQVEQAYYQQIREQADKMLAPDREQINQRTKYIQRQVAQQIKAYGGDKAKFLSNGGMQMLNEYSNKVLDSDEVSRYKQNKQNLERILDAQGKGLGSRVAEKDLASMKDYFANGGGEITYQGLYNEIELPPSNTIEQGTEANYLDVLYYGKNYHKVLGNYMIDNPEENIESLPRQEQMKRLQVYAAEKNWSQRGTMKPATSSSSRSSSSSESRGPKRSEISRGIVNELNTIQRTTKQSLTLEEMDNMHSFESGSYASNVFGSKKYNKTGQVDPSFLESVGGYFSEVFTFGNADYNYNNTYRPKGALDLGDSFAKGIFKGANGLQAYTLEGNVVKDFDPDSAKGLKLADGTPYQEDALKKGDYKIVGAFMGNEMKAMNNPDETYLIMDPVDEDGKIDEERKSKAYVDESKQGIKGRRNVYVALEKDGNTIYQRVDLEGTASQAMMTKALEEEAVEDLTSVYEQNRQTQNLYDEKAIQAKALLNAKPKREIDHDVFDSNLRFDQKIKKYNSYTDNNLRAPILKALYMTLYDNALVKDKETVPMDDIINSDAVETLFGELDLTEIAYDRQVDDLDFLKRLKEQMLSPGNNQPDVERNLTAEQVKQNNYTLYEKIKAYYQQAMGAK